MPKTKTTHKRGFLSGYICMRLFRRLTQEAPSISSPAEASIGAPTFVGFSMMLPVSSMGMSASLPGDV